MFENDLLPIGSVVVLHHGSTPLMIYGRMQQSKSSNEIFDYVACLYPYGNLDEDHTYLFNHNQVHKLLFVGYQTPEEEKTKKLMVRIKEVGPDQASRELESK